MSSHISCMSEVTNKTSSFEEDFPLPFSFRHYFLSQWTEFWHTPVPGFFIEISAGSTGHKQDPLATVASSLYLWGFPTVLLQMDRICRCKTSHAFCMFPSLVFFNKINIFQSVEKKNKKQFLDFKLQIKTNSCIHKKSKQ